MPYYWGSKGAEKPADGYPMYLYIHGSGPKQAEWKTGLNICSRFDDAPSTLSRKSPTKEVTIAGGRKPSNTLGRNCSARH